MASLKHTHHAHSAKIKYLRGAAQNYAWGKPSHTSKVADLLSTNCDIDDTQPYAELWMGTHVNGPSHVILDDKSHKSTLLSDFIKGELPYLYKVLSVDRSLSIQAHPDKELATQLHKERPKIYRDANHKPEMAVALTPFEVMCGFRPISEISHFLQTVPEFNDLVGNSISEPIVQLSGKVDATREHSEKVLKDLFSTVMTADPQSVQTQVEKLVSRLRSKDNIPEPAQNEEEKSLSDEQDDRNLNITELILRLNGQFPGDVGIFAAFLLNAFRLQPGEAIFLEANLPHAYLDGDCIECMACSDNVVRAGLTPKLRDTPVLCEMLNYLPQMPLIMGGHSVGQSTVEYSPKVAEFRLQSTVIEADSGVESEAVSLDKSSASDHHSIVLVLDGKGTINYKAVNKGDCLLVPPSLDKIVINADPTHGIKVARCYTPSK